MGRQIQVTLLAMSVVVTTLAIIWMLEFRPVVYEITVYMDTEPTPQMEVPVSVEEPVSPRERALFDRAYSMSDKAY